MGWVVVQHGGTTQPDWYLSEYSNIGEHQWTSQLASACIFSEKTLALVVASTASVPLGATVLIKWRQQHEQKRSGASVYTGLRVNF